MFSKIKYTFGNHTDIGKVRKVNQDSFGSAQNDWGEIFVVADGMGGHKGGEVASKMAVDHICDSYKGLTRDTAPAVFLNDAILGANDAVITKAQQDPDCEGMGTTIVAIIIKDNEAHIAHVGDSRLYIFRHSEPFFITKDHSVVQDLVDKGLISESEAETHPNKNRILQAIGTGEIVPTITKEILYKGDYILLCSDGLSGEVNNAELYRELKLFSPMEACKNLVGLANERGGPDNITVVAVRVEKGENPPKKRKDFVQISTFKNRMLSKPLIPLIVGLLLGIIITIFGIQFYKILFVKEPKIEIQVTRKKKEPQIEKKAIPDTTNKKGTDNQVGKKPKTKENQTFRSVPSLDEKEDSTDKKLSQDENPKIEKVKESNETTENESLKSKKGQD